MSSITWSAPDVADAAGVTYRQLDYWIREQLLPFSDPTPGTGHARTFTTDDRDIARWMGALVRHGIDPKVAAPLAAELHQRGYAHLGLFLITTRHPVLTSCPATDGHRPDLDGRHCRVCGARLDEVPC